ncbi:unnamed protein product [Cyprideis torosa]|uniref:Uncharacterized protein n=1 Tax=Cyprideis torosa TaxID=163714 RepID=A0A7R8ZQI0_9CRUS|nr:unnamed protein product [Cyprideis torosa]CAG0896440.1 unnamed protein product [Cyprideis torosa]
MFGLVSACLMCLASTLLVVLAIPMVMMYLMLRSCLVVALRLKSGRNVLPLTHCDRSFICQLFPNCAREDCHECIFIFLKTHCPTRGVILNSLTKSYDKETWPTKFRSELKFFWRYAFWIEDPHFCLESHVEDFSGTMEDCLKTPHYHPSDSSNRWIFLICTDGIVFRVHHALMDAISSCKFIAATIIDKAGSSLEISPVPKHSASFWVYLFSFLNQNAHNIQHMWFDKNQWMIPHPRSAKIIYAATKPFSTQRLKKICAIFGGATISELFVTAILTTIVSLTKDIENSKMSYFIAFAYHDLAQYKEIRVDHHLGNATSGYRIKVQPRKMSIVETLEDTQRNFRRFKTDPFRMCLRYWFETSNYYPWPTWLPVECPATTIISSVPGLNRRCKILGGNAIDEIRFHCNTQCSAPPFIFHFISYAESVTLTMSIDFKVLELSGCTAPEFLQLISQNISELEKCSQDLNNFEKPIHE